MLRPPPSQPCSTRWRCFRSPSGSGEAGISWWWGAIYPIPVDGIVANGSRLDLDIRVVAGDELGELIGEADVLTDAHAPVDQLLTPGR